MTSTARQILDEHISEAEFQAQVIELAKQLGWLVYHVYDSRRSEPGFPDLCLAHPDHGPVIFAELKSQTGRLRQEQRDWLSALNRGDFVDESDVMVRVWRPSDFDEIQEVLTW